MATFFERACGSSTIIGQRNFHDRVKRRVEEDKKLSKMHKKKHEELAETRAYELRQLKQEQEEERKRMVEDKDSDVRSSPRRPASRPLIVECVFVVVAHNEVFIRIIAP